MGVRHIPVVLVLFTVSTYAAPLPSSMRRGEQATLYPGSMHDFFFDDFKGENSLDSDTFDYDLLTLLFQYAGQEDLLKSSGESGNGFTLFAPTDEALTQSARDIREIYNLADTEIPVVASSAWQVYKAWFKTLDDPKATLTNILKFHIVVNEELTDLIDITDVQFTTSNGQILILSGTKLENGDSRFEIPQLTMDCHYTMDNGVMHPIDRMLFPDPNSDGKDLEVVPPISEVSPSPTSTPTIPTEQSTGGSSGGSAATASSSSTMASTASDSELNGAASEQQGASCFSASATVHLSDGSTIPMSELSAGHAIMSSTKDDRISSPVYLFSHRQHDVVQEFISITSQHGHKLSLTAGHYLYANGRKTAARRIQPGDLLQTIDGESIVTSVTKVYEKGLFAPHTLHGDIVVNGILASSYTTAVSPRLAHTLLWPLRMLVRTGFTVEPLGSILYNGSPKLAAMLPSGFDQY